ncbi:response regulator [Aureimonas leprariae]|uniref:Response regulator n=1 Tax=Plantimonas leprariae TaxID=2615207 RepID=A0A7V7TUR6_9HYPH|nr:response regulator [Aureimonas leprariae]KAB0676201.1 response regulator [Aureimonas leprariae]
MQRKTDALVGRHILIVEDDWFIVEEIVQHLETAGAIVVAPASDLAGALGLAAKAEPLDGAILNVSLHDELTYTVADVLRERGVPFAFATGFERREIPKAYADVPHIDKPFETSDVVRALFGPSCPKDSAV